MVREIIRRARACRWKPHAALFKLNPVRIIIGGQLGPEPAHSAGSHLRIRGGNEKSGGRERGSGRKRKIEETKEERLKGGREERRRGQ